MDRLVGPGLCVGFAAGAATVLLASHLPFDLSILSTLLLTKIEGNGKRHLFFLGGILELLN